MDMKQYKINECADCDCYDSDMGCTMPSTHKWYACPIESEKEENKQALQEYAEWLEKKNKEVQT